MAKRVATKSVSEATSQAVPVLEISEPFETLSEALTATTALVEPIIHRLSEEQLAIATSVKSGNGNILVRARAGTGKTYLIRRCIPLMNGDVAIAAYNRKIAREIALKLVEDGQLPEGSGRRPGLNVGTFHSFGWRVLMQHMHGVRLEGRGKNSAGFHKFEKIAERLNISKPLHSVVRKAMERAQERLLELGKPQDTGAATTATAQAFLDGLVAVTVPEYRNMMASIADFHRSRGFLTEKQHNSAMISARRARRAMPSIAIGQPAVASATVASGPAPIGPNDELDPAWFDLAQHHSLELDLPAEDSIEMQMLSASAECAEMSQSEVRALMLKKCLVLAAKAIHESARMASETFTYEYRRGQQVIKGEEFTGVVSFSEMLYLPLYFNMAIPQYDWVCVDEAQDSNPARREFAKRMCKPTSRMFWVGDDRQAIYGWAGADNDALDQIIAHFACTVFPMTVTFRCGKAIVALAQRLVPDYKAAASNAEGLVSTIDEGTFGGIDMLPTDAVLCRNTAPLVKTAYKLIARGVACHVEGKDIGKQLLPLLYRWTRIKSIAPYVTKLTEYRDAEIAKFMEVKNEAAAEALNDRVDTILAIIEFLPKNSLVSDIQVHVEKLFADTPDGEAANNVTLMTIHRSKGLEFPRVFGLGTNKFLPSPYARQDWQKQQEENLLYVNYTRAITDYVDVTVV